MDFQLTYQQRALIRSVETLLERYAGKDRAHAVLTGRGVDHPLMARLGEAGFLDPAGEGLGPLEAVFVSEAAARHAALAPIAARVLVVPVLPEPAVDLVALGWGSPGSPVRFGAQAQLHLRLRGDGVIEQLVPTRIDVIETSKRHGYPLARVHGEVSGVFDPSDSERVLRWWRVALAAELAGTMEQALAMTVDYVGTRSQFGKPLSAQQGVQRQLAEAHILTEGSRWLARRAAWEGAPAELAAASAAYASRAAGIVLQSVHQVSGAIGITDDYGLITWTMRLQGLRNELGGPRAHAREVARARYRPSSDQPLNAMALESAT